MKVGTKSILFGAHQFAIHPWFVAWAWWKLYGFPFDPRLWLAFFVHDLGYLGKASMDGPEGESHVELGAKIMGVFGERWADFSRYHSRFYAKRDGEQFSRLCVADKLSFTLTPRWLYLPMVRWTGEIHEYMNLNKAEDGKYGSGSDRIGNQIIWFDHVKDYLRAWVAEHRDGREDTWTKTDEHREAIDESGVWK